MSGLLLLHGLMRREDEKPGFVDTFISDPLKRAKKKP